MKSALPIISFALAASVHGAVLVQHDFGGDTADPLNGVAPDTNILSSANWVADSIFAASGQVTDGSNTDRGAYIDLGASFAFVADETYTLTLSWTGLDNAILFAGFMPAEPDANAQMQTQDTNFALRARRITAGTDVLGAWQWPDPSSVFSGGTTATPADGTAVLTLETGSLTDAEFTVDGATRSVDLTAGYRYLWIGYEDPLSGTSDARVTRITFEGIPEPSVALIGALGLVGLLRRRR